MAVVANEIDLNDEDRYWRQQYEHHQYFGRNYDEFEPAFRYGWEAAAKSENHGRAFEEVEPELCEHWSQYTGSSRTDWDYMRAAAHYGYNRIQRRLGFPVEYRPASPAPEWENVKGNLYNSKKLPGGETDPDPKPSPGDVLRKEGNR